MAYSRECCRELRQLTAPTRLQIDPWNKIKMQKWTKDGEIHKWARNADEKIYEITIYTKTLKFTLSHTAELYPATKFSYSG
jgi:hypothetical protein